MIRRCLKPTLLVIASLVAALFLSELIVRIVGAGNTVFYVPDPITGFSLRPNAEGWWAKEGRSYVRINSAGLRDIEHPLEKPANTYRIAVLGDSYAEALQVSINDTFWKILERELAGCPSLSGRSVEAINFGVSSYGTAQQVLTLQTRVKHYKPDMVLLAFVTGNDIRNNSYNLELDPLRPYFVRRGTELELDDSFRQRWVFYLARFSSPLMEYSRLMQLADGARITIKHALVRRAHQKPISEIEGEEPGLDSAIYVEPLDQTWKEAWAVTEMLLERFSNESNAIGAKPLLVTLSNGIQVHPSKAAREQVMRRFEVDDLFYPESRVGALAKRYKFPLLILAPRMQKAADESGIYFHGFGSNLGIGHWNEAGHRYAGRYIAKELCSKRAL